MKTKEVTRMYAMLSMIAGRTVFIEKSVSKNGKIAVEIKSNRIPPKERANHFKQTESEIIESYSIIENPQIRYIIRA